VALPAAQRQWIWKAFDRATGRLVDWECGDERTFRRLFERLARWKVRLFCSDNYVVYPLVLGGHYQGKSETWNATTASNGTGLCAAAPSLSPNPSQ
jgi:IS1 family transposase